MIKYDQINYKPLFSNLTLFIVKCDYD